MIDAVMMLLLLAVPGLPLLLTIPAMRRRLSRPLHIALVPAIVLVFVPGDFAFELPWMLLGSAGVGLDTVSRWWLVMSVIIWAVSAASLRPSTGAENDQRLTALLLLTLAGQLGTIVATNLVIFFTFMTLMGYSFAGLLLVDDDGRARRAGRWYLVLLIVADIILFEALLMAGGLTDDLGFATVAPLITESPSPAFYYWMVIIGFALKAGFWPLHQWQPLAYGSSCPRVMLLLWLVPVAISLLGLLRWMPPGTINDPVIGTLLLASGAGGILYAVTGGLRQPRWQRAPIYPATLATGVAVMCLGIGLVDPALWNQYGTLSPAIVATIGLGLMIIARFCSADPSMAAGDEGLVDGRPLWAETWAEAIVSWVQRVGFDTLPALRDSWITTWYKALQAVRWQRLMNTDDSLFQRWPVAITFCLTLGLLSVVLLLLNQ